ncbi:Cyanovirin-N [Parathielavia appendiculata]|uniref:Cyanovirin-N n=1 Tax=Parathielavia appendiculata TaxID=2587402 RepID=A0AAN6U9X3_9PEZI|nr:Cyanovirin-N [Parathielavia appendiculata]
MSFHASAQDIRVDDGHILRARLTNLNGEEVDAELDLNDYIGNNDGSFEWGGVNFSESAEDITFSLEGGDSVPVLRAGLRNADGELVYRDINLAERIHNNDGSFYFGESR